MRFLLLIILMCVGLKGRAAEIQMPGHNQSAAIKLENIFMSEFGNEKGILYKTVPRGLIISFHENYFFDENFVIKEDILKRLANLVKLINLPCSIEVNTKIGNRAMSLEASIMRSQIIVGYLIKKLGLNQEQIRAIGFGDLRPYKNNGQWNSDMDNRVDVVIFYY